MTPEEWQQVKDLFHAALQREPSERANFLDQACSGHSDLRHELESLLESYERSGEFIDGPAYQAASGWLPQLQALKVNDKIGRYEILAILGRGGMGEVYLARDVTLGRKVALKLLPGLFTRNSDRLRRFEQEARTVSALNHPNILTIHEIGEANDRRFFATEFVDGLTLRQRISAGPLKPVEALNIAEQIASALAAAHSAGIVHRDIKPENIMLRHDGFIKLLDFGLAKLTEARIEPEATTAAKVHTSEGVVMGTVSYMSPEQARGLPVDVRTDIWSLGVVLYEMLRGQAPFAGQTSSDVLANVLQREPASLRQTSKDIPEALDWIVSKALIKDRDERYQTAREMLTDLRRLKRRLEMAAELDNTASADIGPVIETDRDKPEFTTTATEPKTTTENDPALQRFAASSSFRLVALGTLLLLTGLAVYLVVARNRSASVSISIPSSEPGALKTTQITAWSGLDIFPSLSPDGNSIAYSSDQSGSFEIYVKQLTPGGRVIQLTNDGRQNFEPAWSPDGKLIAYHSKGLRGIWVVAALGGTAKQIADFGSFPAWSPDGSQIALQSATIGDDLGAIASGALLPSTIWIVSADGSQRKQITNVGVPAGGHGAPCWSPDGKRIAFGSYDPAASEVWSVSPQGETPKRLARGVDPVYSPDGRSIYFVTFGTNLNLGISKIDISPEGDPIGEPVLIANTGTSRVKRLTMSADGKRIGYGALGIKSNLWSVPILSATGEAASASTALTQDTSYRNSHPNFSPDGKTIAFQVNRVGASQDIWLLNADGTNLTQLTSDPAFDERPTWFPDGQHIAFLSRRQAQSKLWSIDRTTGRERVVFDVGQDMTFPQVSPDGKRVIFNSKKSGTTNIWVVAIEGGQSKQLTFDQETMGFGCWSPDSKWIAFEIKRGDDSHIGIMTSNGGEAVQLTSGREQAWPHSFSPDGDKIAFAGFRDGVWNIWWVSRTTKQERQITHHTKLNAFVRYPAWSPLGNQIVYEYAEQTGNIWMIDLKD